MRLSSLPAVTDRHFTIGLSVKPVNPICEEVVLDDVMEDGMLTMFTTTINQGHHMNYVLVRHKVADFAEWKAGYDSHLPVRDEVRLKEIKLLQNAEDANEVVVLFEAADVARAKAFCASDDLRNKMKEVGVVGPPEILFLTD